PEGELAVRAMQPGPAGWGLDIVAGNDALAALATGNGVVASERLALSRGLEVGDEIALPTPDGEMRWPVAGLFRDFNTGDYSVVIALDTYRRTWRDETLTGVGLQLRDGADPSRVESDLRAALPESSFRLRSS